VRLVPYLKVVGLIVVGAFAATIATPQYRSTVLRLALFALAATVAVALVERTRQAAPAPAPSPFEPAKERRVPPSWPGELDRLAIEVRAMAAGAERNAGVVPGSLRRSCRRIASARLADHHGVDIDSDRARAAMLCGPDLWAALDGEPSALDVGGLVAALEQL
jgi:hypothetical protein